MNRPTILKDKSFQFGHQIIGLTRILKEVQTEHVLCRQLLRAGTAVGALVREAEFAQSKADFINKMSIALKEANEADYWLNLLSKDKPQVELASSEPRMLASELIRMLVASIKTAKSSIGQ